MIIDDLDSVKFKVTLGDNISIKIYNISDLELGEFRIKKERARSFLEAMQTITREQYGPFEEHDKLSATIENKDEGLISF